MRRIASRGKVAHIWISLGPAKAKPTLGVVFVVVRLIGIIEKDNIIQPFIFLLSIKSLFTRRYNNMSFLEMTVS